MDIGLELLMNPKKKSSEASSICSGDVGSVKSLKIPYIHSAQHSDDVSQITDEDVSETSGNDYGGVNTFERIEVNDMDDTISTMSYQQNNRRQSSQHYQNMYSGKKSRTPSVRSQSVYSSSEEDSEDSKSDMGSLGSILASGKNNGTTQRRYEQTPRMSEEEIINAKRELLYQFDRLEKKGMKLPRKFTMASSLDDMKAEYERLKRDRDIDSAVRFQRRALMFFTSGVEMVTNKFDGLGVNLDGWSESVHDNIEEYDETFEELYDKYKGKAKMAPELKLVFALGMSAFTFNMTRTMMKSMPGVEQVFKQNPELMKQFAAATANTMSKQEQSQGGGGLFGGLGGLFSNLFGGGGGAPQMQSMPQPEMMSQQQRQQPPSQQQMFNMKGPSNIDDLINDLERNDNDRIEIMSTVSGSEFTELEDDISINNLMYGSKKKRAGGSNSGGGRKITLDI